MAEAFAPLAVFVVLAVSLVIIRLGSLALVMTGLSPGVASFQALSAFSGAGFTTEEAEETVSTPARRDIVKTLIRLGSVGLVTAIFSLVVSFTGQGTGGGTTAVVLVAGVLGIVALARSRWFNRLATPVLEWLLIHFTDLEPRDYTRLLHMEDEYRVAELTVDAGSWLADRALDELDLPAEGIVLLGILREDGDYRGAPGPDTRIEPGDKVIAYGQSHRLRELVERSAGDTDAHERAVREHRQRRIEAS